MNKTAPAQRQGRMAMGGFSTDSPDDESLFDAVSPDAAVFPDTAFSDAIFPDDDFSDPAFPDPAFPDTGERGAGEDAPLQRLVIPARLAGERLDKALTGLVPTLSRTRLGGLIKEGCLTEAGSGKLLRDPAERVRSGQQMLLILPPPVPATPEPQAIPLEVVYEDASLLVINKPAGLVVHPAPGIADGTLVNALLHHCGDQLSGIGGVRRPGIVHRLDKDTSGLLVAAKTDPAHRRLCAQFADHSLSRTYLALVWGVPTPTTGMLTGNIGRDPRHRKRMAVVASGGKPALTRYRVLETYAGSVALVCCRLATGRTHQIRVHLTAAGWPLVGDPLYGRNATRRAMRRPPPPLPPSLPPPLPPPLLATLFGFPRQALHAAALEFMHPDTHSMVMFTAAPPPDLATLHRLLLPYRDCASSRVSPSARRAGAVLPALPLALDDPEALAALSRLD